MADGSRIGVEHPVRAASTSSDSISNDAWNVSALLSAELLC